MEITITLGGELAIDMDDSPTEFIDRLKAVGMVLNEEREKKAREKIFGWWDLPEYEPLWREERRRGGEHLLLLPRGMAFLVPRVLEEIGGAHTTKIVDQRTSAPAAAGYYQPFLLRDLQARSVAQMMSAEQGFFEAPAGAGKTVTILGMLGYLQQRALIMVERANLVEQWRKRAHQYLGLSLDLGDDRSVGKIGEGMWEPRDLTIALRQTLYSRGWETDATGFWGRLGVVVIDEGHHVASDTNIEVLRRVTSRYFFGTSATPVKSEAHGQKVAAVVGPVIAKVTRQELYDAGLLMRPNVEVHHSDFEAEFWPTHDAERDEDGNWHCEKPGCKVQKAHQHRNNYASVLKKLVEDKDRNIAIAQRIVGARGRVHLVYSRQLKHLDLIRKECEVAGWDGPMYYLRGAENAQGLSEPIAEAVAAGGQWEMREIEGEDGKPKEVWQQVSTIGEHGHEAIVFSTVADEGMDIPPLDTLHVVFPGRQEAALVQVLGRVERIYEGKHEATVVDWQDLGCRAFKEQALERERVYRSIPLDVRYMSKQEA
jgi:superfamily II DNA or RNA helicase